MVFATTSIGLTVVVYKGNKKSAISEQLEVYSKINNSQEKSLQEESSTKKVVGSDIPLSPEETVEQNNESANEIPVIE